MSNENVATVQPAKENAVSLRPSVNIEGGLVQLTNLEGAYRFAQYVISSGLAPKGFEKAEAVLIAWQYGAEVGFKPMQSLQNIAVINGRPSLFGKAALALVRSSGKLGTLTEKEEGKIEDDTFAVTVSATRKGEEGAVTCRYSAEDAKRAKLWGKTSRTGEPTPWITYPKEMLRWKARARVFGNLFADVLIGLPLYEDIQDIPADNDKVPLGEMVKTPEKANGNEHPVDTLLQQLNAPKNEPIVQPEALQDAVVTTEPASEAKEATNSQPGASVEESGSQKPTQEEHNEPLPWEEGAAEVVDKETGEITPAPATSAVLNANDLTRKSGTNRIFFETQIAKAKTANHITGIRKSISQYLNLGDLVEADARTLAALLNAKEGTLKK